MVFLPARFESLLCGSGEFVFGTCEGNGWLIALLCDVGSPDTLLLIVVNDRSGDFSLDFDADVCSDCARFPSDRLYVFPLSELFHGLGISAPVAFVSSVESTSSPRLDERDWIYNKVSFCTMSYNTANLLVAPRNSFIFNLYFSRNGLQGIKEVSFRPNSVSLHNAVIILPHRTKPLLTDGVIFSIMIPFKSGVVTPRQIKLLHQITLFYQAQ